MNFKQHREALARAEEKTNKSNWSLQVGTAGDFVKGQMNMPSGKDEDGDPDSWTGQAFAFMI